MWPRSLTVYNSIVVTILLIIQLMPFFTKRYNSFINFVKGYRKVKSTKYFKEVTI